MSYEINAMRRYSRQECVILPVFWVPYTGWLTTTGLSQRRLKSNFFSRRQQLCREFGLNYSARFLPLFLYFSHFFNFFFFSFFLLPSLLHWLLTGSCNFTLCVDRGTRGAVQEKAGPNPYIPPLWPMTAALS